jgi:hypothetical protein
MRLNAGAEHWPSPLKRMARAAVEAVGEVEARGDWAAAPVEVEVGGRVERAEGLRGAAEREAAGRAAYASALELETRFSRVRACFGMLRARWVILRARCVTLRARWVTLRARWVMLIARWVTLRARWVTLRARWVTLRARWVTLRARWVNLRARWVNVKSSLGEC